MHPLCRFSAGCAVLLAGCAPTPQIAVPTAILSDEWTRHPHPGSPPINRSLADMLGSAPLAALIDRAMIASPALLAARARVDQTLSQVRIARATGLPLVSASAGGSASRVGGRSPYDFTSSFAALDASISIDLSGGIAAGRRAARERVRAADLDTQALALDIGATIATVYVLRAAFQARLALIDRQIAETTQLQHRIAARQRRRAPTPIALGLQAIRVQRLIAERSRLDQSLDQTRTALALLLGEEAPRFATAPADLAGFDYRPTAIPRPSQLLVERADIAAAEHRILAAGGDVAQARAAFFPRLDLSVSRSAENFLTAGPFAGMSVGGALLAPIFGRSRLRGNLEFAAAGQREAVANYRQTLLAALADVENALSAVEHARSRAVTIADIERRARATAALAERHYLTSGGDFWAVIDAQDLSIAAQDARIVNVQEQLEASIALYRTTRRSVTAEPAGDRRAD